MPAASSLAVLIASAVAGLPSLETPLSGPSMAPRPSVEPVVCGAPAPATGSPFSGPVLHVLDGRTLCVAQGPLPADWIRVELAGAADGDERSTLMAAAFGQRITCVVDRPSARGVVASCSLDDLPLGQLMQAPAIRAEAAFWR